MIENGLVDEVKKLQKTYKISMTSNSMRCVGYRQTLMYLEGLISHSELRDRIIFATRQLAKRQITWMRKMEDLHLLDPFDCKLQIMIKQLIGSYLS